MQTAQKTENNWLELMGTAQDLIEENSKSYQKSDKQGLIDHVTSLLRDFKQEGFTHIQIKAVVTDLVESLPA